MTKAKKVFLSVHDMQLGETRVIQTKNSSDATRFGIALHQVMDDLCTECSYQYLNLHKVGGKGVRVWRNK